MNTKIVWNEENDRWIFTQRDGRGEITGLNFMQGKESIPPTKPDEELTRFFRAVSTLPSTNGLSINDAIWAWLAFHDPLLIQREKEKHYDIRR